MKTINRSALVHFSAEQMYRLVDDIENYPEFVPNCRKAKILERDENHVSAQLEVAKSGIAKSFSTKNTLTPFDTIHMQLLDGPFKHLSGQWHFKPLADNACKVELHIEFEFNNKLASIAFAKIFNQLIQSMVSAFTDRAQKVYG